MCWNKTISLNTFIVSIVVLTMIYMNKDTVYKFKDFDNNYMYLFLLSVSSIQLVEYFLWKNIENNNITNNTFYTKLGLLILLLQPIFSLQLININSKKDEDDKNIMLTIYVISIIFLFIYKKIFNPFNFTTNIVSNHLSWGFMEFKGLENIFLALWVFTISFVVFKNKNNILTYIISIFILAYTIYKYNKDNTWGSMWCWASNSVFLYYLIQLLLIKPYNQYKELC